MKQLDILMQSSFFLEFNFNAGTFHGLNNDDLKQISPQPFRYDGNQSSMVIFGTPILEERINHEGIAHEILSNGVSDSFLKGINGEFLIVVRDTDKLVIINDRFTSIPLYYACFNNKFVASSSYYNVWCWLKDNNHLSLNQESFFQIISMRRLFGTETHDRASCFLPPASVLEYNGDSVKLRKYWTPQYHKMNVSLDEASKNLAYLIRQSLRRKLTDHCKPGLFLSGGMDTRTVLAGFPVSPVCFTATMNQEGNREFLMAKAAAESKGSEHIHLQLSKAHYKNIYDDSIRLGGAMYEPNAIFMGYKDIVSKKANVLFHGHGFDYMFQGMYIPSENYQFLSRALKARKIRKLGTDVVGEYISTVSYRAKYKGIYDFIAPKYKDRLRDYLYQSILRVYEEGKKYTQDPYDLWGYLSFHALARHYSYPDHASIHLNGEQRAVTFDNHIYDFYLSLPLAYRFDARVLRSAIKILSADLASIPNANDGLPFSSSRQKTYFQFRDALLTRLKLKRKSISTHLERTWPTHKWLIEEIDRFRDMALSLSENSPISELAWLDMKTVKASIQDVILNRSQLTKDERFYDLVWNLMGINRFFEL